MISYGAQSVARLLAAAEVEAEKYSHHLAALGHKIDEIALLVSDRNQLDQLDKLLSLDFGWERFNVANDEVATAPIRSRYTVEYHFFRKLGTPWRLEVMRLTSGVSPLHAAIPSPLSHQAATLVHASFKAPSEEEYAASREYLKEVGYRLAQQCDSTYGRFSYFTTVGRTPCPVPYLKPRVNTRDR